MSHDSTTCDLPISHQFLIISRQDEHFHPYYKFQYAWIIWSCRERIWSCREKNWCWHKLFCFPRVIRFIALTHETCTWNWTAGFKSIFWSYAEKMWYAVQLRNQWISLREGNKNKVSAPKLFKRTEICSIIKNPGQAQMAIKHQTEVLSIHFNAIFTLI